jgi:hypothetical protein
LLRGGVGSGKMLNGSVGCGSCWLCVDGRSDEMSDEGWFHLGMGIASLYTKFWIEETPQRRCRKQH